MASKSGKLGAARHFYMVTFEIAREDEAEFNEIYDTEHVPNILKVKGVVGVVRFKDAVPNAAGWLVYSALYLLERADLPDTPERLVHLLAAGDRHVEVLLAAHEQRRRLDLVGVEEGIGDLHPLVLRLPRLPHLLVVLDDVLIHPVHRTASSCRRRSPPP